MDYELCKNPKCAANWRKAKHASGYCSHWCAEASGALAEETLDYELCKNPKCAANWRKAKHASGYCSHSCAEASGALEETLDCKLCKKEAWVGTKDGCDFCLVCLKYLTDEHLLTRSHQKYVKDVRGSLVYAATKHPEMKEFFSEEALWLVDGPPQAISDTFLKAAMDEMKETSNERMEKAARLHAALPTEDHGKRMQRAKELHDEQVNAARKEHAEDMADALHMWNSEYSKERIVMALLEVDLDEDDALRLLGAEQCSNTTKDSSDTPSPTSSSRSSSCAWQ